MNDACDKGLNKLKFLDWTVQIDILCVQLYMGTFHNFKYVSKYYRTYDTTTVVLWT